MVYLEKSHSQKTVAHLQSKCKKWLWWRLSAAVEGSWWLL